VSGPGFSVESDRGVVVVIEDSSPIVVGPFATEDEAIEYARNNWEFFDRQVAVVQQRPVDFEDSDEG
jgi:hypothetical protein